LAVIFKLFYPMKKEYEIACKTHQRRRLSHFSSWCWDGVDSGLPDFRGKEGFWKAYPPMAKLGLNSLKCQLQNGSKKIQNLLGDFGLIAISPVIPEIPYPFPYLQHRDPSTTMPIAMIS
jgi:hypothetical protein